MIMGEPERFPSRNLHSTRGSGNDERADESAGVVELSGHDGHRYVWDVHDEHARLLLGLVGIRPFAVID